MDRIFVDDNIKNENDKNPETNEDNICKIEFEKIYEEMVKMSKHLDTDVFVQFESPNVSLKDITKNHKKNNSNRKLIKRETMLLNE